MTDYMRPDLDATLEVANRWREASGQEILTAWIPSVRGKANACLLARAFNKSCAVDYQLAPVQTEGVGGVGEPVKWYGQPRAMREGSGHIRFEHLPDAQLFAEVTGWEMTLLEPDEMEDDYYAAEVALPDEITLVAYEFDHGRLDEHVDLDQEDETRSEGYS